MEWIADALDKPLPEFLEETDLDSKSLVALVGVKLRGIAEGCACVSLILPSHQGFIARQWTKNAMEQLNK